MKLDIKKIEKNTIDANISKDDKVYISIVRFYQNTYGILIKSEHDLTDNSLVIEMNESQLLILKDKLNCECLNIL